MELASTRALGVVAATMTMTSCGFLAPSETGEVGPRDTAVGFEDGPGIEVCFGEVPVVSASRAKGGALSICLPASGRASSCSSSEACATGESCVCGRCVTRPCRNATECDPQEVCQNNRCTRSCAGGSACEVGETCAGGGCARACERDEACAWGETCSAFDGRCVVKLCGQGVSCGADEACVEQQRVADLREPEVVEFAGETWAYVEVREAGVAGDRCAVHRARIASKRRWIVEPFEPVLAPIEGDGGCIGAPSAVVANGEVTLFAQRGDGRGIVRARSLDGWTFDRDAGVVLEPEAAWEDGWVGAPGAVLREGSVLLMYEAARGQAVGMARVEHEGAVRVPGAGPALTPSDFEDPVLWRQIERIGAPFARMRDGSLMVYLTVRGVEGSDAQAGASPYPADANDSIGLASTDDLITWTRFPSGPVFARRTNLRAYLGEREPCVLDTEEGAWLAYVGADASGDFVTGLGLAVAKR